MVGSSNRSNADAETETDAETDAETNTNARGCSCCVRLDRSSVECGSILVVQATAAMMRIE